jgi:hypothetical protein
LIAIIICVMIGVWRVSESGRCRHGATANRVERNPS